MNELLKFQKMFFILALSLLSASVHAQTSKSGYYGRAVEDIKIIASREPAKPYRPSPDDPRVNFAFPEFNKKQINPSRLGTCLAKITDAYTDFPLSFSPSKSLCISLTTGKDISKLPNQTLPTFLNYLASKPNRACDYASGKEDDLKSWVLSRKEHSIDLVQIYDESLHLNQGDIYNAVLTIHQLLRNNARWWDIVRYNYHSDAESQRMFFNKFIDIRGDLRERGAGFYGDHAGSWYRIWGLILFQLNHFEEATFQNQFALRGTGLSECHSLSLNQDFKIRGLELFSSAVSVGGEKRKYKLGMEEDMGKVKVDIIASETASEMIWALLHRPCSLFFKRAQRLSCTADSYLSNQ